MKDRQDVPGLLDLYAHNVNNLNAIHLANIYGALAKGVRGASKVTKLKTNWRFNNLLKMTSDKLQRTPNWFGVREIATITHSLGKLNIFDERFFNEIGRRRERIAKEGEPQHLSMIVWACATIGWKSVELLEAVAGEYERIAENGNVQELSNITWACATLGYKSVELLEAVAGEYERIAENGNVQAMSNICWAFAKVGHEAKDLFKAVAAQHGRFVRDGNVQEVANTLWSFAIAGYLDEGRDLVEKLWNRACDGRLQFNDENLRQLALFYASAQIEEPNLNLEPPPESLLGQIEAAAAKQGVTDSREQNLVSSTLKELNIDHKMEVSPFESSNVTFNTSTMLNIDIVISTKVENKNIAIEFNGPIHYIQFDGRDFESGTTKFKRRLLENLNFTVVSIHWDVWRKAREANTHKEFVLKLLN